MVHLEVMTLQAVLCSLQQRTVKRPTERTRIDSSGNVGIGTASPSVELSLAGSDPQLCLWEGTDGASS